MPRKPATPCSNRACPNLKPCPTHTQQRASRQERGYDRKHDKLRKEWKPIVDTGRAECNAERCLMPSRRIKRDEPWDLGHTPDRTGWVGPEHARCNRATGGRAAHGNN